MSDTKYRIYFLGNDDVPCEAEVLLEEPCDAPGSYLLEGRSTDVEIYLCPEHKEDAKTEGLAE